MNKYNVTTFTRANLGEALEGFQISYRQAQYEVERHHKSFESYLSVSRVNAYNKVGYFSSRDLMLWLGY
jgi:hypothetical protein